jgi:AGCS family alanine or glycine:cation symporter
MSTKYAEGVLGVVYRKIDKKKEMCGGPMYYLEHGAKSKFLSISFAILCSLAAFTSGGFVQANSIAIGLQSVFSIDPLFTGIFLAVITGLTLFKGIKSIGKICGILVPAMGIFYILGGLFVIAVKYVEIPRVISLIFSSAFTGQAATGGFVGSTILIAMQFGVSRAIFSSEAGLGTSPIASASAKTNSPVKQALISMSGVFITSFVICTITGLVIGVTNSLGKLSEDGTMINGSVMAIKAFEQVIPGGGFFVAISIFLFGFSTILGWAYYGEKALEYLFDLRIVRYYRVGFTLLLIPGSFLSVGLVWSAMNIMNALMSIPNLIGLLLLAKVVSKYTKEFDTMVSLEKQSSLKKVSKA